MNKRLIKTYVFFEDKCFFVSTINRESSAMLCPDMVYAETMVFDYDWNTGKIGNIVHQDSASRDNINVHQRICDSLYRYGEVKPEEDE